jgi:hypothetical protein
MVDNVFRRHLAAACLVGVVADDLVLDECREPLLDRGATEPGLALKPIDAGPGQSAPFAGGLRHVGQNRLGAWGDALEQ